MLEYLPYVIEHKPLLDLSRFTLCILGNFACFLSSADFFFKINFFEKFFQEYHQCQTVCKNYQQTILVGIVVSKMHSNEAILFFL